MIRLVKIINGRTNVGEPEKKTVTASETYSYGEALKISSGALTKCAATDSPLYISAEDYIAPATGARKISVFPVSSDMIFETKVTASPSSLKLGDKVTLGTDAMSVTATTTSGVATIVDFLGATAANDKILVKF